MKTGLGRGEVEVRKWEGSQATLSPPGSSGSCGSEGILDQNPWAHQSMLEQHTCDWDLANSSWFCGERLRWPGVSDLVE